MEHQGAPSDGEQWQIRRGDEMFGALTLEAVDMFWTDCHFQPGPDWPTLQPLIEASRAAWVSGDREAALKADREQLELGLELVPNQGGPVITGFLLRVNGSFARFRH